jgi:hypothetical protein
MRAASAHMTKSLALDPHDPSSRGDLLPSRAGTPPRVASIIWNRNFPSLLSDPSTHGSCWVSLGRPVKLGRPCRISLKNHPESAASQAKDAQASIPGWVVQPQQRAATTRAAAASQQGLSAGEESGRSWEMDPALVACYPIVVHRRGRACCLGVGQ